MWVGFFWLVCGWFGFVCVCVLFACFKLYWKVALTFLVVRKIGGAGIIGIVDL